MRFAGRDRDDRSLKIMSWAALKKPIKLPSTVHCKCAKTERQQIAPEPALLYKLIAQNQGDRAYKSKSE
jgi:hypothetical protein